MSAEKRDLVLIVEDETLIREALQEILEDKSISKAMGGGKVSC
jgi:CheY-like chemotaxis protein